MTKKEHRQGLMAQLERMEGIIEEVDRRGISHLVVKVGDVCMGLDDQSCNTIFNLCRVRLAEQLTQIKRELAESFQISALTLDPPVNTVAVDDD